NVRFFLARLGEAAIGCGAVALFDGYAEVKRMYTREAARGRARTRRRQGAARAYRARGARRQPADLASRNRHASGGGDRTLRTVRVPVLRRIWPLRRAAAAPHCHEPVLRKPAVAGPSPRRAEG